jgi:hypothetical protein
LFLNFFYSFYSPASPAGLSSTVQVSVKDAELKRRACLPSLRGDGDGGEALAGRLHPLLFSFFGFPLFPFDSVPVYFSFPAAPEMTKETIMKSRFIVMFFE